MKPQHSQLEVLLCCVLVCVISVVLIFACAHLRYAESSIPKAKRAACIEHLFKKFASPQMTGNMQVLPGYDGLFVIHYNRLIERRVALEKSLARMGLQNVASWVDWLNKEDVDRMDDPSKLCLNGLGYDGNSGLMSLNLKHLWVYWYTASHKLQNVLVMEDDPLFQTDVNIVTRLHEIVTQLPRNYSIAYVGTCSTWEHSVHSWKVNGRLGNRVPDTTLFGPGYPSRCANGYVLSERGAREMLLFMINTGIHAPADNMQDEVLSQGSYWTEEPLWKQTDLGSISHEVSHDIPDVLQFSEAFVDRVRNSASSHMEAHSHSFHVRGARRNSTLRRATASMPRWHSLQVGHGHL